MESQLDIILNSLRDATLGVDEQSHVVLLNEAAASLFGCARPETIGGPAARCPALAEAIRQLGLDEMSAASVSPKPVHRLAIRRTGQEPLTMEAAVSCAILDGKRVFVVTLRDLSGELQMERAVYEARKTQALGALASGIAHDFNNILAATISQIDLVLHTPGFPVALKDHLIYAQTSARRGAELVSKLQAFSRQGKSVFSALEPMNVIDQVAFVLRRSIDPKIVLHCAKPAEKPWLVRADANQITQALLNLGINARDAMPQGGTMTLSIENVNLSGTDTRPEGKAGDFVRLMVTDTGPGMTPEVASRIFEPYFTTKDPSRGQGLGLSIAAAVVAEHSGWMEVESHPGRGTRFSIFLPRSKEAAAVPKPIPAAGLTSMEGRERILVVDDEELVRLVTKAVLAYRGYQIVEAEDGEDAVQKYERTAAPFDLVLMDMHMPRLNGHDALRRIREINPKAKAVILSGGIHEPEECIDNEERVAFLHKPFENQELLRVVRRVLDSN
jgi:signal transduction histidine kinase/CheY-like chemotaxis protein